MEFIDPVPPIHPELVLDKAQLVGEGTHAFIYKVRVTIDSNESILCIKVFREGWMSPYNREITAYAYLLHAEIEGFIPKVYGKGKRTVTGWGLDNINGDKVGEYYGILMEWIEGSEPISYANVTIDNVVSLTNGLYRIHEAGVLHDDPYPRNMLVVPGTSRGVWIDFSCSQVNVDEFLEQEMRGGGSVPAEMVRASFFIC
jgi:predicted Ser/Thr protein kinase